MDDIVKQAMSKWPDVPSVYGWLALDRRGNWLIKGERISNTVVTDFIARNYEHDNDGRWYFQNGPQLVFINLDYTPHVYRLRSSPQTSTELETHSARNVRRLDSAWIDEGGTLLLDTEHGIGLIDDRDLDRLLTCFTNARGASLDDDALDAAIEQLQARSMADLRFSYNSKTVPVQPIAAVDVPRKFNFVQRPLQPVGEEECR